MQRYTLKFNFQIKFYFFIENLCFCSLKIAVCVLKITIISKNCRLKITAISKNYGLKILVRVRVYARIYARMYARASDCGQIIIRTHDRNTRPPEKGGTPAKRKNLNIYVCLQAMKKKYKKS